MRQAYIRINGVYRRVEQGYHRVSNAYKDAYQMYIRISNVYKHASAYIGGGTFSTLARSAQRTWLTPTYTFYKAVKDGQDSEFPSADINRAVGGGGSPDMWLQDMKYSPAYSGKDSSGRPVYYAATQALTLRIPNAGSGGKLPPRDLYFTHDGVQFHAINIAPSTAEYQAWNIQGSGWAGHFTARINSWRTVVITEFTYN